MIDILSAWPLFIVGLLIGFIAGTFIHDRSHGVIHITHEEDHDNYLFEFNIPPEDVPKMKQVIFATKIEEKGSSQNLQSF